jgi:hypothetical protein
MAFVKREWFFIITKTALKRGWRFKNGDKPTEEVYKNLTDSAVFKTEPDDRARINDPSADLVTLNGHTVLATDAEATSNAQQPQDRSLVAQPSQLPTSIEDSSETLSFVKEDGNPENFEDSTLSVDVDQAVGSRNQYVFKWTTSFSDFFKTVLSELESVIAQAKQNVSTLASHNTRITSVEQIVDPSGTVYGILPIGSVSFHVDPSGVADTEWKPLDGVTEVSKWVTPGDQGSGESAIYTLLKNNYDLDNGANPDYFVLPDYSNAIPYQQGGALGPAEGKWGGQIQKQHLPRHAHNEDQGGTLLANSDGDASKHSHGVSWSSSNDLNQGPKPLARHNTGFGGDGQSSNNFLKSDFQRNAELTILADDSSKHTHSINGMTGTHDSDWG